MITPPAARRTTTVAAGPAFEALINVLEVPHLIGLFPLLLIQHLYLYHP